MKYSKFRTTREQQQAQENTMWLTIYFLVNNGLGCLFRRKRAQRREEKNSLTSVWSGGVTRTELIFLHDVSSPPSMQLLTIYLHGIITKITLKRNRATWLMEAWLDYQTNLRDAYQLSIYWPNSLFQLYQHYGMTTYRDDLQRLPKLFF